MVNFLKKKGIFSWWKGKRFDFSVINLRLNLLLYMIQASFLSEYKKIYFHWSEICDYFLSHPCPRYICAQLLKMNVSTSPVASQDIWKHNPYGEVCFLTFFLATSLCSVSYWNLEEQKGISNPRHSMNEMWNEFHVDQPPGGLSQ